jgi:hypothetical protein
MDNKLENIKESIYFHLTGNEDKPISLYSMWNQMISDQGWRCSELKISNKQFFITEFHCIPNEYKDVYKFYKNGIPYLVFTQKPLSNFDDVSYNQVLDKECFCSLDDIVDSYIQGKNNSVDTDFVNSLIQTDNTKLVEKLLNHSNYFENEYDTFIKHANSSTMSNYLLQKKYETKICELNGCIFDLRKTNSELRQTISQNISKINSLETTISLFETTNSELINTINQYKSKIDNLVTVNHDLRYELHRQTDLNEENNKFYSWSVMLLLLAYLLKLFNFY